MVLGDPVCVSPVQSAMFWLGREDSNLRMQEPKSCVLPLDDAPKKTTLCTDYRFTLSRLCENDFAIRPPIVDHKIRSATNNRQARLLARIR